MATGALAHQMLARHGHAIERLTLEMAAEEHREYLVDFLAYDAANFVYAFLLASGNGVSAADRRLRDQLQDAIVGVLAKHGIDRNTFALRRQFAADGSL